jgi:hypothetical protein
MLANIYLGDIEAAETGFKGVLKWHMATPADYQAMMDLYVTNALFHRAKELWNAFQMSYLTPTERFGTFHFPN